MTTFIQLIARDLLQRFGNNLRDITVVFPNKRAGLFMNQQLAAEAGQPVWAPRYRTISELFDTLSDLSRCDDVQAVCELYNVYAALVEQPESLDRFYSWGEVMLADFDDIDKHLAPAERLFSNIQAIKEMDGSTYLSEAQEEALRRFFEGFSIEGNSKLKERFLQMWNRMSDIYTRFNHNLRQQGVLYEGALYRDVAEHIDERMNRIPPSSTFVMVGFNVLNEVEKTLFRSLATQRQVLFYWDYDLFYTREHPQFEAGTFIRQNLLEFPSALPETCFDNLRTPPEVSYVATSSNNAQARHIADWLQGHLTTPEQDTAIVLCDEHLLQPVLHAIPGQEEPGGVKAANITMGFPLADTPIYTLTTALIDLQTDGYDADLRDFRKEQRDTVMSHPYYPMLSATDTMVAQPDNLALLDWLMRRLEEVAAAFGYDDGADPHDVYRQLYGEALYRTHQTVSRFRLLMAEGTLDVQADTLRRLIHHVLTGTAIPFHGEPATGLQVMGLLETRNLNFRHILMLSVNEGMLPKQVSTTSFVPYNLREAFGLTTIRHKNAVYAYYFYRLLQRTEHITLAYNTANDALSRNEMSRFLRQLLAETDIPISTIQLQSAQRVHAPKPIIQPKTPEVMRRLLANYDCRSKYARPLSPSALNTYIDCPLRFYFEQVAGLRKPNRIDDEFDAALFGTIFHDAAEMIYSHLTERGPEVRKADLEALVKGKEAAVTPYVEASILRNVFDNQPEKVYYDGHLVVVRKVIITYLLQLLAYDLRRSTFEVVEMEQMHFVEVEVPCGTTTARIMLGGKIDRIDRTRTTDSRTGYTGVMLHIIDYKTGGKPETATQMDKLFSTKKEHAKYMFQTFLYSWVMTQEQQLPVSPTLFYVHLSNTDDYDPSVTYNRQPVTDFGELSEEFEERLRALLAELYDPEIPFTQTTEPTHCMYCDHCLLCGIKP